jgi:hypothetical protein
VESSNNDGAASTASAWDVSERAVRRRWERVVRVDSLEVRILRAGTSGGAMTWRMKRGCYDDDLPLISLSAPTLGTNDFLQ